MTEPEPDLVRRAQRRDADAFEQLVRLHARLVWAMLAGMVRDRSWTEDLVQETFLKAWKAIDQLENPSAFRPWLLSIARRLVLRHSSLLVRPALELEEADETIPPDLDRDATAERVHSAVQNLPERYRLPITLRYLSGLNYAQISQELGLSNGTLRGLVHRGVRLLRKDLASYWKTQGEVL